MHANQTTMLGLRCCAIVLAALTASACEDRLADDIASGVSTERGKRLLDQYQCGSCHAIPGIPAARSTAGPPLEAFGRRSYIAGHIPNRPDLLAKWIADPHAMISTTTMPAMGVSPGDARDMAAYLHTLK
ncbi:MAG TPA: c-type cytochrome [Oxalicibacterium sp.]|nr:c-type cytochrome [Oxalicibacterium sp.]